jgi:hypothetical protein
MEDKAFGWLLILMGTIMLCAFLGMGIQQHNEHECRMEAMKSLTDPKLIAEVCK